MAKTIQSDHIYKPLTHVTYEMFGAPLNGIDDDTLALKQCHEFANKHQLKVEQHRGKINLATTDLHGSPLIKTDTDLSGMELILDDNMDELTLYKLESDEPVEEIEVNATLQSQLKEDALTIPALSAYKFSLFVVESDELLAVRENGMDYFKHENFTIGQNGTLIDGGLLLDYTTGNLKLTRKSILDRPITVKAPFINVKKKNSVILGTIFSIKRSNVSFQLSGIDEDLPLEEKTSRFRGFLIEIIDTYNFHFFGGIGENSGKLTTTNATQSQYIFKVNTSSKIKLTDLVLQRGWGAMNTEFIKDMTIRDCVLNRTDSHFGMSDLTVENVRIVGNNGGVQIGWGKGNTYIKNVRIDYSEATSSVNQNNAITFRTDLGMSYEGNVTIDGLDIKLYDDLSEYKVMYMFLGWEFDFQYTRQLKLPRISLNNVTVTPKVPQTKLIVTGMDFYMNGKHQEGKLAIPQELSIHNLILVNEGPRHILRAVRFDQNAINGIDPSEKFKIAISNTGRLNADTFNRNDKEEMVFLKDATTKDVANCDLILKHVAGRIKSHLSFLTDLYVEDLVGEIVSDDQASFTYNKVEIEKSRLIILSRAKKIVVNYSQVEHMRDVGKIKASNSIFDNIDVTLMEAVDFFKCNLSGQFAINKSMNIDQNYCFDHCDIYPQRDIDNKHTVLTLGNTIMRHCFIHAFTHGDSYLPVHLIHDHAIILLGNIVVGEVTEPSSVDRLFHYISNGFPQPKISFKSERGGQG
ncbi:hypothetical protein [Radiobacillus sp. PE A8.2]|uniref:hypothetical protein n=1 Tax=Radiobacillus sp. PE A8.2 TaxID=3380349 RepID=UPI00388DA82E